MALSFEPYHSITTHFISHDDVLVSQTVSIQNFVMTNRFTILGLRLQRLFSMIITSSMDVITISNNLKVTIYGWPLRQRESARVRNRV